MAFKPLCHFSPVMKTAIHNFPFVSKTKFWKFILAAANNRNVIHYVCSLKVALNIHSPSHKVIIKIT